MRAVRRCPRRARARPTRAGPRKRAAPVGTGAGTGGHSLRGANNATTANGQATLIHDATMPAVDAADFVQASAPASARPHQPTARIAVHKIHPPRISAQKPARRYGKIASRISAPITHHPDWNGQRFMAAFYPA